LVFISLFLQRNFIAQLTWGGEVDEGVNVWHDKCCCSCCCYSRQHW